MRRHSVAFADFAIKNPRSSVTASLTVLYTMTHLFTGFVLPLADSFVTRNTESEEHTYYLEAFLMFQSVTAMMCIFYLQLYIFLYERHQKKKKKHGANKIKSIVGSFANKLNLRKPGKVRFKFPHEGQKSEIEMAEERQDTVLVSPNPDLNLVGEEDVVFDCSRDDFEVDAHLETVSSPDPLLSVAVTNGESSNGDDDDRISNSNDDDSDCDTESDKSTECSFFVRDSEGINLYLRLGAVAFAFGVMVHDGFKIADYFRHSNCHNPLWNPKQALHLAYIFTQTFFAFKYHRVIFRKQKQFIRLILWHLTVVNICQWFKTVVYEINHELLENRLELHAHDSHHSHDNRTIVKNIYRDNNCMNQLAFIVSPFLFPCAIEYSLISAAIFYKMLQKVGRQLEPRKWVDDKDDDSQKYTECHRSHKGLFIGLLFFMVTLVGLAVFHLFQKESASSNRSVLVYQISELTLLVSSIMALCIALYQMNDLSFRQLTEEEALDDNLLFVGLLGVYVYNLFLLLAVTDRYIRQKSAHTEITIILFICKSAAEMIQSVFQVFFVMEGSRRYSELRIHVRKKPGRSVVTFLMFTNIALWVVSIFETKRGDQHEIFTHYFQKTPWSIITHTLLPLIIFFRFHSSVCLSDMWTKSYRKRSESRIISNK